jgi:hypothetical protein
MLTPPNITVERSFTYLLYARTLSSTWAASSRVGVRISAHRTLCAAMLGVERMQPLQDRQREAGGLAGAGLCAGEQVAAGRRGSPAAGSGSATCSRLVDRLDERFGQAERFERHRYHS